ncbi:chromosomal replication initiator protein DnaA [bacterium]|nr:chromosomal replication initiator protein DnaA [bacterium]
MDYNEIWQAVLGELELTISKASFTTWFKNTHILEIKEENILIAVPNGFTKRWLENKYNKNILEALKNVLNNDKIKTLNFKISHNAKPEKPKKNNINPKTKKTIDKILNQQQNPNNDSKNFDSKNFILNPQYNFENFISGKQNELAKAASMAAAKNPGKVYNPLFLYGDVGLGKTHLMHSISNYIKKKYPQKKLIYISSENFTNDYVKSIRSGNIDNFKKKYREVDILLVDDIQFMKGQERTQEEFFHTFNVLYQSKKQIVISSDRPPKSLPAIEKRLTSRFESGMIADIGTPDLETRVAILQSKIQEKNISLEISEEILTTIANIAHNNVRELEGALNRVIAIHQLNNQKITPESIKEILSGMKAKEKDAPPTNKKIIKIVAEYFDIKSDEIIGACRKKELVTPRQICMHLMRTELNRSYPSIGDEIGGRDHTTAIHGFNKIEEELKSNEKMKHDIQMIKERLYS